MSITDKPNSLRWMIFINIVTIFMCMLFVMIVTSFFTNEYKIPSGIVAFCLFIVIMRYIFDIWEDEIFTDPRYKIKKEEMDKFLKQKINFKQ